LSEGGQKSVTSKSTTSAVASGHSSQILSEILVFPEPQMKSKSKRKPALSSKTVCVTNDEVLERLKAQEAEKCDAEAIRKAKQLDKQQKKREREEMKEIQRKAREKRKIEREKQRQDREKAKQLKKSQAKPVLDLKRKQPLRRGKKVDVYIPIEEQLNVSDGDESTETDEAVCPKCGAVYGEDDTLWICCDGCEQWFDQKCTSVESKALVPELYFCESGL